MAKGTTAEFLIRDVHATCEYTEAGLRIKLPSLEVRSYANLQDAVGRLLHENEGLDAREAELRAEEMVEAYAKRELVEAFIRLIS